MCSGLPRWHGGKESARQCRKCKRCGFDPWVGKIPWSRGWQPTPVFLPGEFCGQRNLVDYIAYGVRYNSVTKQQCPFLLQNVSFFYPVHLTSALITYWNCSCQGHWLPFYQIQEMLFLPSSPGIGCVWWFFFLNTHCYSWPLHSQDFPLSSPSQPPPLAFSLSLVLAWGVTWFCPKPSSLSSIHLGLDFISLFLFEHLLLHNTPFQT